MGTTKKDLVSDLEKKPRSLKQGLLIKLAKIGHYHDFDSQLEAPKMQLVTDLKSAGFEDLAQRVVEGAYDDERPTLEQQEELRKEFGPEAYDRLMGEESRGKA